MTEFAYQGGHAFAQLDYCARKLAEVAFAAHEAFGPNEFVKLTQADSQALIDAMHDARVAWIGGFRPPDGES